MLLPHTATVPPRILQQRSVAASFWATICIGSSQYVFGENSGDFRNPTFVHGSGTDRRGLNSILYPHLVPGNHGCRRRVLGDSTPATDAGPSRRINLGGDYQSESWLLHAHWSFWSLFDVNRIRLDLHLPNNHWSREVDWIPSHLWLGDGIVFSNAKSRDSDLSALARRPHWHGADVLWPTAWSGCVCLCRRECLVPTSWWHDCLAYQASIQVLLRRVVLHLCLTQSRQTDRAQCSWPTTNRCSGCSWSD